MTADDRLSSRLEIGVMNFLALRGIGVVSPPGGVFPEGTEIGITSKALPNSPHRCVSVTVFAQERDVHLPSMQLQLQIRTRGRPRYRNDADDLIDDVIAVLDRQTRVVWSGFRVQRCLLDSMSSTFGPDSESRWERTANFTVIHQRKA